MKLTTPIDSLMNTPMTTADLQLLLLNGANSPVSAISTPLTIHMSHMDRMLGGLHQHQSKFMVDLFNVWNEPASELNISSARQLGTTFALLSNVIYSMMTNPHQTIVFICMNTQLARETSRAFQGMVSYLVKNCGYPDIISKSGQNMHKTRCNGKVLFNVPSTDVFRGQSIGKLIIEHTALMTQDQLSKLSVVIKLARDCHANITISNTGYRSTLLRPDAHIINRNWDDHPKRDVAYFDQMKHIIPNPSLFNQEMNL